MSTHYSATPVATWSDLWKQGFGTRLRQQRERRGVELAAIAEHYESQAIAARKRLSATTSSTGPPASSGGLWVRNYAQAIGADADAVVREMCALYPEEEVSVERESRRRSTVAAPRASGSRALNLVSWTARRRQA